MTERDIAAEVIQGLHEVREHHSGKRTLRETRIAPTPIPELNPGMAARIRESLEGPGQVADDVGGHAEGDILA